MRGSRWAVLLLLLWLSLSQAAGAQATTTVRCRLETANLAVGAETALVIEVADVADLYGYQVKLSYDPARIQVQDGDGNRAGTNLALGGFLSLDFVVLNEADQGAGVISLAVTQVSPSPARNGSGELARATVQGVSNGSAHFAFREVILSDPNGMPMSHQMESCAVVVGEGSQTPATPTPTATAEGVVGQSPTNTPTPMPPTPTMTATPTRTPTAPAVATPVPAPTSPLPTATWTATSVPTLPPSTATADPTATPTVESPGEAPTPTPVDTATAMPTATPSPVPQTAGDPAATPATAEAAPVAQSDQQMEPTATAVTMARAEGGDAAAVEKVQRPSAPEKASRGKLLGLLASVGGLAMLALIVLEGVAWWLGRRSRG